MIKEECLEYDYEDDEGIEPIISLCRCCNSYHEIHDDCDIDDYEEAYT